MEKILQKTALEFDGQIRERCDAVYHITIGKRKQLYCQVYKLYA